MATFDFITSEEFRSSLESDYDELRRCVEARALKAAHVLAGSIIEALLADYLVSMETLEEGPVQRMNLSQIVEECTDAGLISQKVADLSSAIRGYRNLIHPGRAVRTAEKIDGHSASIVASLVELIVEEVAERKRKSYGFTAEQIVNKLEKDSSAIAIAEHLLRNTRPQELRRLLLTVIPNKQLQIDDPMEPLEAYLEKCFAVAFDLADNTIKHETAAHYVEILREESDKVISEHDEHFFQIGFLDYLDTNDVELVKQHLFAVLQNILLYRRLSGFGAKLSPDDAQSFVDPLVRVCAYRKAEFEKEAAESYLREELAQMDEAVEAVATRRVQAWKKTFEKRDQPVYANVMRRLLGEEELAVTGRLLDDDDDLPF